MMIGLLINLGSSIIKFNICGAVILDFSKPNFLNEGLLQENSSDGSSPNKISLSSAKENGFLKKSLISKSNPTCESSAFAFVQLLQPFQP